MAKARYYIDGNTVKKARPHRQQTRHSEYVQRKKRKTQQRTAAALRMDTRYVALFSLACLATLFLCLQYLHMQARIMGHMKAISSMELQLEHARAENDNLENLVNTSVDLEYVKYVALTELGMIPVDPEHLYLFNRTEPEYVRQYEDLPEE